MSERGRAGRTLVWGGIPVAVVLLCLAAWQWWGEANAVATPPGVGRPSAAGTQVPASTASPGTVHEVGVERVVAGPDPSAASPTLRVVDEHGVPVADAEVAWSAAMPGECAPVEDVEAEFAEQPRLRTASDGTVTLPGAARSCFVLARKDTAFGCGLVEWDPFAPVPELVMAEDRTLHARVVGPDGTPRADVPVVVRWQTYASPWLTDDDSASFVSDAEGLVTIWHVQTLGIWDRTAPFLQLSAQVLGAEPTTVRVSLSELPPGRIELPCAAHGSLRLQPRLPDGSACRWRVNYEVALADDPASSRREFVDPGDDRDLLVPAVALGRTWRGRLTNFEWRTFAGPTIDGQEVVVAFSLAAEAELAMVRLRWADGSPVADLPVMVDGNRWNRPRTDGDGRLVFDVAGRGERIAFLVEQPRTAGSVPFQGGSRSDRPLYLGEVRMLPVGETPLLVSGRVVDATTGAGLCAQIRWRRHDDTTGYPETELDGSFFVREANEDTELELTVDHGGFESAVVVVPRGSRDVHVALRRLPQLRATILLDADIQLQTMGCELRRGDDRIDPFAQDERPGFVRCTFALPDGAPAPDLAFVLAGADEQPPLRSVPSGDWHHERGDYTVRLDLRGRLANVIARAFVGGAAVELDQLLVRPLGAPGPWADIAHGKYHGCTALRGTTFDAIAVPRDALPVRMRLGPGENRIDLPPPATVAVQLPGWPDDCEGRVVVRPLTWHEPLLTELDEAGVLDECLDPRDWPRSRAEWRDMRDRFDRWLGVPGSELSFPVVRRGSYLVVPCVLVRGSPVPLLAAAAPFDVATPGQRIDLTIRIDPTQLEAARR